MSLMARGVSLDVHWCVLSAVGEREREARNSATDFLSGAANAKVEASSVVSDMTASAYVWALARSVVD